MNKKNIFNIVIDPSIEKQEIEGWGTTLSWWGNVIGKWNDEKKIDTISDLIFSSDKGLGINVIRYNLGGGEKPQNLKNMRVGADVPSYLPKKNEWNWENDEGQRKILLKAKSRGANIFEAFANTPPDWMTVSGSTAGNSNGESNLCEYMYDDFAEYVVKITKYFSTNYGIEFKTLSPFNEPTSFWWKSENDQEGCYFKIEEQIRIIEKIGKALESKGLLNKTGISAPEGWSTYESIFAYNNYPDSIKKYITQINTHSYFGDSKSRFELKNIAKKDEKSLWMSEVSCGGNEEHDHNDITSALELATNIVSYINEMEASAWVYWQAIEDEAGNHNHGLIHANFVGNEDYWLTKQYYTFANFSKFIKKGSKILANSENNVIVAYDGIKRELIVVAVNVEDSENEFIIDMSRLEEMGASATVYRTSALENLNKLENIQIINGQFSTQLQSKSVTTFIIDGCVKKS